MSEEPPRGAAAPAAGPVRGGGPAQSLRGRPSTAFARLVEVREARSPAAVG